jgi:molybdate transport system substrate-binding protein
MANPDRFPAGQVAREALTSLGVWTDVTSHLVYAASDRNVLSLLAHGEAGLGIVYATEARGEPLVRVVDTFPASTHAPIRYPLALGRGAATTAAPFVAFLRGADAAATFGKYGFGNPGAVGIGTDGPP